MNEGAEVFKSYMQTGEMGFERAFTAAVESTLGVEVFEAPANATQETAATTIQTLAFADQDDCYPTKDEEANNDFCAASLNHPHTKEQL